MPIKIDDRRFARLCVLIYWKAPSWCSAILLSAAGFTRMAAAVFKIHQFIGVVSYEQGELFCQGHRLGKVADNILDIRFFLLGAHGRLLARERIKSIFTICCIIFDCFLYSFSIKKEIRQLLQHHLQRT